MAINVQQKKATFAGGCFWCLQPPYDQIKGVLSTTVGYTGGQKNNPNYEEVCAGWTGHLEAIEIVFDPSQITYEKLVEIFWKNIDPIDALGQFCDKGEQYKSALFYHDEEQKQQAEKSKRELESSGKLKQQIVTEIRAAAIFYPAEDYHQEYYKKNPIRYKFYRFNCGRDQRLEKIWGISSKH